MATIVFECTKKAARDGKTYPLKFQFDFKGTVLSYQVLRDGEAAFQRWFRAHHFDDSLLAWEASVANNGIVAQYRSSLPYGFSKTDA